MLLDLVDEFGSVLTEGRAAGGHLLRVGEVVALEVALLHQVVELRTRVQVFDQAKTGPSADRLQAL